MTVGTRGDRSPVDTTVLHNLMLMWLGPVSGGGYFLQKKNRECFLLFSAKKKKRERKNTHPRTGFHRMSSESLTREGFICRSGIKMPSDGNSPCTALPGFYSFDTSPKRFFFLSTSSCVTPAITSVYCTYFRAAPVKDEMPTHTRTRSHTPDKKT